MKGELSTSGTVGRRRSEALRVVRVTLESKTTRQLESDLKTHLAQSPSLMNSSQAESALARVNHVEEEEESFIR